MARRRSPSTARWAAAPTRDLPFFDLALMDKQVIGQALGVGHLDAVAVSGDEPGVPHLAAGLAVEGGGRGDDLHFLPGLGLVAPGLPLMRN